jgi:hypothetical protein
MRPPRNPLPLPVSERPEEKRRHGRLRAEMLSCPLGQVQDISASGVRVFLKGRLRVEVGQELQIDLKAVDRAVPVDVKVMWIQQRGWRRFELGLQFQNVSPPIAIAISELARYVAATADRGFHL